MLKLTSFFCGKSYQYFLSIVINKLWKVIDKWGKQYFPLLTWRRIFKWSISQQQSVAEHWNLGWWSSNTQQWYLLCGLQQCYQICPRMSHLCRISIFCNFFLFYCWFFVSSCPQTCLLPLSIIPTFHTTLRTSNIDITAVRYRDYFKLSMTVVKGLNYFFIIFSSENYSCISAIFNWNTVSQISSSSTD